MHSPVRHPSALSLCIAFLLFRPPSENMSHLACPSCATRAPTCPPWFPLWVLSNVTNKALVWVWWVKTRMENHHYQYPSVRSSVSHCLTLSNTSRRAHSSQAICA
ncbi:hypothetical protein B0F90DRAFT_1693818 [Multifurca ochricompacta]|uniref:Secreted protein n=1 Tax=Multifurca ochricompacta TaxID=376703 RepID=A0AAD4M9M2_9AGAM|nr:hypothetical protein B0F90DRAFT_1693818 [Multifurca ochricompacta]